MSSAWSILAKVAAFFAVVLVVSLGLCGFAVATVGNELASASFIGMVIGAAGFLLTAVAAVIVGVVRAFKSKAPPPTPPPPC